MSDDPGAAEAARNGRRHSRRRLAVGGVVVGLGLVIAAGAGLVAFRYLPALDEARTLRADLEAMVDRVQEAGLDIDAATVSALRGDLAASRTRLGDLEELVAGDPVIAVARMLPPTGPSVRGADAVLDAGDRLLDAAGEGLVIADRFVEIREGQEADPGGGSALAELVELMATTRPEGVSAAAAVADARAALAAVPDGAIDQVARMRDAMAERIDRYAPLLNAYVDASDRLPAILGWDGPRRYLVLTQDPAELRPSGGFIGTYGLITFERGRISSLLLTDTGPLDYPYDYPWIDPPGDLVDYLLGPKQPWQFADANWSPDFPTSARDALRLYTNESGDADIDGVIAITTFTIDELLTVTGPLAVPEFDTTVAPGETTLKVLELTRTARSPGEHPKAFMFAFADQLVAALQTLPPGKWADLVETAARLGDNRQLQAWFVSPEEQSYVVGTGFSGAVRPDPGDFVYVVDSNVAPVSKLNILTTRSLELEVELDAVGNAHNKLRVTWENGVDSPAGEALMAMDNVGGRILGLYSRVLVPERSRIAALSGGSTAAALTHPAVVEDVAGRTMFGVYVQVPAGRTTVTYEWTSPYAADANDSGGAYRLTMQKQPGLLAGPITLTIRVPDGHRITEASPKLSVSGDSAMLSGSLDGDLVVGLRYALGRAP